MLSCFRGDKEKDDDEYALYPRIIYIPARYDRPEESARRRRYIQRRRSLEPFVVQVQPPERQWQESPAPVIYEPRHPISGPRLTPVPSAWEIRDRAGEDLQGQSRVKPSDTANCAEAMILSVRKARQILYQVQKRNKPRGRDERNAFDHEAGRLDEAMGRMESHLRRGTHRLPNVLTRTALLRLDREFRTDVTEPLKMALLMRTQPNLRALRYIVNQIKDEYKSL
ncbi:hypothetical protein CCHR01_14897 [Colletotrichum chrysophilum]|uniref:Uncharacterized protein n=1 Tax=Colletotrichum chrysophilum TaxID=1836956 RepID=A0AAD9EF29_9PEZI|nr:hypothetical protein CCHR01_14897 [Colletotrichum chrysophilum]